MAQRTRTRRRLSREPCVASRGVETLKVASSANGESHHDLTVRVYGTSGKRRSEAPSRSEKIVVNLKQSVSTRAVLSGNRKQFNIRSYGSCDGKEDTHENEYTYFRFQFFSDHTSRWFISPLPHLLWIFCESGNVLLTHLARNIDLIFEINIGMQQYQTGKSDNVVYALKRSR